MYHIAVLTKSETQETFYREQLSRFCAERGLFPRVDCYRGQEVFFEVARKNAPTNAVISLPGVDGLNAVEHLRALFPETRIIWCTIPSKSERTSFRRCVRICFLFDLCRIITVQKKYYIDRRK